MKFAISCFKSPLGDVTALTNWDAIAEFRDFCTYVGAEDWYGCVCACTCVCVRVSVCACCVCLHMCMYVCVCVCV
jgi:hypothetical protein